MTPGATASPTVLIMEHSAVGKDPVVVAAPVRFVAGAALLTALQEVLHQVVQMFAMRQFPCAWHSKDIRRVFFGDQAQGRVGRKARIGHHIVAPRPREIIGALAE